MKIKIKNINNIPEPTDKFGILFVDDADFKLKLKTTNGLIVYNTSSNNQQNPDVPEPENVITLSNPINSTIEVNEGNEFQINLEAYDSLGNIATVDSIDYGGLPLNNAYVNTGSNNEPIVTCIVQDSESAGDYQITVILKTNAGATLTVVYYVKVNVVETPSESDKTTYIVSNTSPTWLNGDYTDIGVTYGGNPVYAFETSYSDYDNLVAFIFFIEERWILGAAPDYLENVGDIINWINRGYSLFEAVDMFGTEYYHSESGINGPWIKSWGGTDDVPTVTLKSSGESSEPVPDEPSEPETEGGEFPEIITVSNSGNTFDGEYPKINRFYNSKPIYATLNVVYPAEYIQEIHAFFFDNENDSWVLVRIDHSEWGANINNLLVNSTEEELATYLNTNNYYVNIYYKYSESDNKWVALRDDSNADAVISFNPGGTTTPPQESVPTTYIVEGSNQNEINGEYVDSGKTINNNPVYITNSSNHAIVLFNHEDSMWSIRYLSDYSKDDLLNTNDNELLDICTSYSPLFISDSITGTWETITGSGNITVTLKSTSDEEVPEEPSEPDVEVPEGPTTYYEVTDAGDAWAIGAYIQSEIKIGEEPIYVSETTINDSPAIACLWKNSSNRTYLSKVQDYNSIESFTTAFKDMDDKSKLTVLQRSEDCRYFTDDTINENGWGDWYRQDGELPTPTVKGKFEVQPNSYLVYNSDTTYMNGVYSPSKHEYNNQPVLYHQVSTLNIYAVMIIWYTGNEWKLAADAGHSKEDFDGMTDIGGYIEFVLTPLDSNPTLAGDWNKIHVKQL